MYVIASGEFSANIVMYSYIASRQLYNALGNGTGSALILYLFRFQNTTLAISPALLLSFFSTSMS